MCSRRATRFKYTSAGHQRDCISTNRYRTRKIASHSSILIQQMKLDGMDALMKPYVQIWSWLIFVIQWMLCLSQMEMITTYSLVMRKQLVTQAVYPYSEDNKKIHRQFEGAATSAKMFSKFLQDRRNAPPYVLFEARMAIQSTSANSIATVSVKLCWLIFMTPLNAFALGGGGALSIWFRSVVGLAVCRLHGFKVVALHSSLLLFLTHKESHAIFKLIFSYKFLVCRHFTCNAYDQRSAQPW